MLEIFFHLEIYLRITLQANNGMFRTILVIFNKICPLMLFPLVVMPHKISYT
jgi:hypothetical protein